MSEHKTTVVPAGQFAWAGRCSCKAVGPVVDSHWTATKWTIDHERVVAQVRAHHSHRLASLRDQRDYFLLMAIAVDTPDEHRSLWTALAEELDRRIAPDSTQEPTLF